MNRLIEETSRRAPRRRKGQFLRGLVTAIDSSVSPKRFTVDGRPMIALETKTDLAVGDEVIFANQTSPFILGRVQS